MLWPAPYIPKDFLNFPATLLSTVKACSSRQILALLTGAYAASLGRDPEAKLATPMIAGRQLLQILAPSLGFLGKRREYVVPSTDTSIATVIAQSAAVVPSQQTIAALNACLILSADHEIAPSTYTARVAASGGADIFSCVNSGLGTFEGPLTGLGCDEPERLLRAAASPKAYVNLLKDQLNRKESPMGFNHPLYREGDPRGRYLLKMAEDIPKRTLAARHMRGCVNAAYEELGLMPSLAIGLAVMSAALKLPEEAPGALMAIGRASGWIAHVFEQRLAGAVIQPRTRYVGPVSNAPNEGSRS
jgi:citrate synthase